MTDLPRLLVLGTSHIAALRAAYVDAPERWAGWDVDFIGMPGREFVGLIQQDGALRPRRPDIADRMRQFNLIDQVDLSAYAGFAIIGGVSFSSTAAMIAAHRGPDFPSVARGPGEVQLVSAAFLDAMLDERIAGSVGSHLLRQLVPLGRPIVALPAPLPSSECAGSTQFAAYADMVARGDALVWRGYYQRARLRAHGGQAKLLDWPAEALSGDGFTRPGLMHGSMRLDFDADAGHAPDDFVHGNAAYGALVMDALIAAL